MWKFLVVFSAALGACALEEPPTTGDLRLSLESANAEAGVLDGDAPAEAGHQAISLYQEMVARLDERGVSVAEMQRAVDAGDAERVRELFGFTPAEYEQANARALAVAAAVVTVVHAGEPEHPDGLRCDWEILQCAYGPALVAWLNPLYAAGIIVGAIVVCTASQCEWDDGSGPRTKQP